MTENLHPDDPNRRANGRFAPGNNANPEGRSGGRMTWQDYADRIDHYMTFTRGEIKTLVMEEKEFDKLVTRDALVVQTIAEALQKDGIVSREKILSRVIGESLKRTEIMGADGKPIAYTLNAQESLGQLLNELAARKAGDSGVPPSVAGSGETKPDNT